MAASEHLRDSERQNVTWLCTNRADLWSKPRSCTKSPGGDISVPLRMAAAPKRRLPGMSRHTWAASLFTAEVAVVVGLALLLQMSSPTRPVRRRRAVAGVSSPGSAWTGVSTG